MNPSSSPLGGLATHAQGHPRAIAAPLPRYRLSDPVPRRRRNVCHELFKRV